MNSSYLKMGRAHNEYLFKEVIMGITEQSTDISFLISV